MSNPNKNYEYKRPSLEGIFKGLYKKEFTIKDLEVTHRWITHWEKEGLLLQPKSEKNYNWRKFNGVEYVWMRIVVECRSFNIPLNKIKELKRMTDPKDEFFLAMARMIAISGGYYNKLPANFFDLSLFEQMLIVSLHSGEKFSFIYNVDGVFFAYADTLLVELLKDESFQKEFTKTHISFSLTETLYKLFKITPITTLYSHYKIVSDEEMEIIDRLNEKDIVKAVIVKTEKGKPNKIRLTTQEKFDLRTRIIENVSKDDNQSFTIKTSKGHFVYGELEVTYDISWSNDKINK